MSNRQLEDRQEENRNKRIADEIGLTLEELSELSYFEDTNSSEDGLIYNYRLTFDESSPPKILGKISGLYGGFSVDVSRQAMEGEYEPDPSHE